MADDFLSWETTERIVRTRAAVSDWDVMNERIILSMKKI